MNHTQNSKTPLALSRSTHDETTPFKGDLLQRKELAQRLTGYINRLKAGAVIAIDAPWGEGKTWFGKNWASDLKTQDHKVVFIDAFQQDYIEDPFLLIAAEIANVLDDGLGSATTLRKKAVGVMRAILPVGTKALINMAGRLALGSANLSEEFQNAAEAAKDGAADAAEEWIEKKLEDYANEQASLNSFRIALSEFAAKQDKPVVVFIDELDRCNPAFAVGLIERIKHFFEVPNLVFVLLLNREQLEKSIKGKYGSEVDALEYLGKFVHFFMRLPKDKISTAQQVDERLMDFTNDVLDEYGHPRRGASIAIFLVVWTRMFGLSLRDIKKAVALFILADTESATPVLTYLIALKIKKPNVFYSLLKNESSAHREQIKQLEQITQSMDDDSSSVKENYLIILEAHRRAVSLPKNDELSLHLPQWFSEDFQYLPMADRFSRVAGLIDIPLDR